MIQRVDDTEHTPRKRGSTVSPCESPAAGTTGSRHSAPLALPVGPRRQPIWVFLGNAFGQDARLYARRPPRCPTTRPCPQCVHGHETSSARTSGCAAPSAASGCASDESDCSPLPRLCSWTPSLHAAAGARARGFRQKVRGRGGGRNRARDARGGETRRTGTARRGCGRGARAARAAARGRARARRAAARTRGTRTLDARQGGTTYAFKSAISRILEFQNSRIPESGILGSRDPGILEMARKT